MLVTQSRPTLCYPKNWTVAHKASLAMDFSRQEYWNGLPFPSPGDLHNPRIKPRYPAFQADSLPSEPPGRLRTYISMFMNIYSPSLKYFPHLFKNPRTLMKLTCNSLTMEGGQRKHTNSYPANYNSGFIEVSKKIGYSLKWMWEDKGNRKKKDDLGRYVNIEGIP